MKKLLSVMLTMTILIMPFAQIMAFAQPSAVDTSDAVPEQESSSQTAVLAASSGTCGANLTWTLDDEGTLTISGSGKMNDWEYDTTPWYSSCSDIKNIVIEDSVTSIGEFAFYYLPNITKVTIGKSVESIGHFAFYSCEGITEIKMPDSVKSIGKYAFSCCTSLSSIKLSESLESIGNSAFEKCFALESITLGNSVTSIGTSAFERCENLTICGYAESVAEEYALANNIPFVEIIEIVESGTCGANLTWTLDDEGTLTISGTGAMSHWSTPSKVPWDSLKSSIKKVVINDGVTNIGMYAFCNYTNLESAEIADSVTQIGDSAFYNCNRLESLKLGNGIITTGVEAFYNCTGLKRIDLPDSISVIGDRSFYYCTGLESLKIPDNVSSISHRAFACCTKLKTVEIGKGVTSIENYAFHGCTALESMTVDENNEHYSSDTNGVLYNKTKTELLMYPLKNTRTSFEIPNSVENISSCAFSNCAYLESIEIPGNVENIESEAFYGCDNLKNVIFTNGVVSIGDFAFYNCEKLTEIEFPDSLTSLGNSVFSYCYALEKATIPESVASIGTAVFVSCHKLTIYGYKNSVAKDYADANNIPFVIMDIAPSFSTSMQAYLNLESIISMSVGYKFEDMENINPEEYLENVGLLVWDAENAPVEADATFENCTNVIEGAVYNSALGRFETTTDGIIAKELGDQLSFRAYYLNDDGSYIYSKYITNYSPKTYCYNQIRNNPNDEATIELMASILNYGAAAQKYFKYRTDDLMNSDLPEELK